MSKKRSEPSSPIFWPPKNSPNLDSVSPTNLRQQTLEKKYSKSLESNQRENSIEMHVGGYKSAPNQSPFAMFLELENKKNKEYKSVGEIIRALNDEQPSPFLENLLSIGDINPDL